MVREGIEPPTPASSGQRYYQLSYLTVFWTKMDLDSGLCKEAHQLSPNLSAITEIPGPDAHGRNRTFAFGVSSQCTSLRATRAIADKNCSSMF